MSYAYDRSGSNVALNEYHKEQGIYDAPKGSYAPVLTNASQNGRAYPRGTVDGRSRFLNKKWIAIGIVALIIIVGAVVGGVVGSNAAKKSSDAASLENAVRNGAITTNAQGQVLYPLNSNSQPIYPSASLTVPGIAPAVSTQNAALSCGSDPFSPSSTSANTWAVRSDHPRLFAPAYKWECLPNLIQQDQYMNAWNDTIMGNATRYANMEPQAYVEDGGLSGSGILDPAREIQLRMKHWGYAWKMTNDTQWPDRAWEELVVAAGNSSSQSFGSRPDNWNCEGHFLDCAELTLAFAYAYDWMYDAWNQTQRDAIMWSIINQGLQFGVNSYTQSTGYGWWQTTNGNWNCVCNGGLTLGALAILSEDPTGIAQQLLGYTVNNAKGNCYQAVQDDGTWTETSDYWYFGSTAAAQMWSGVLTATGYDHGIQDANPNYNNTGLFHMYGTGTVQKFNYGDCGPNKYTATANAMMFFGEQFDIPMYTLYQRERADAPEPLSMFWYNPQVTGNWWDGLALDHSFTDSNDTWAAMRSSWTDPNAFYAAIKAGKLVGHQTHGNLDVGTFVFEALGQRWAGELCQNNYLDTGYFASEDQDSQRWLYYRDRTEGQNTLLINGQNQLVTTDPPLDGYGSTGESPDSLGYTVPSSSTSFWVTDMSSAYSDASSVKRGLRTLNGRRQMLIQDEFQNATGDVQWRMHTNATIAYSNNNQQATLTLGGQTLIVQLLSPSGAQFATLQPVRLSSDPALPSGMTDLPNDGVSVLSTTISGGGSGTIEILFSPQQSGLSSSDYITPNSVALSSWSLTSHQ